MTLIAVTGRFQPLHLDHVELLMLGAEMGEHLIVGITNPDGRSLVEHGASRHRHTDEANPYTYYERAAWVRESLVDAGLDTADFTVTPFPLERADVWTSYIPAHAHQVVRVFSAWEQAKAEALMSVYPTTVIQGDPARKIAATDIRGAIARGDESWRACVPAAVARALT